MSRFTAAPFCGPYVFSLAVCLFLSPDEEPLLDVTLLLLLDPESLSPPALELSLEDELEEELDEDELEELLKSSESCFISSSYAAYAFDSSSGFSCCAYWPPFFFDFLTNLCAYLGRLSHITKLSLWFSAMACS